MGRTGHFSVLIKRKARCNRNHVERANNVDFCYPEILEADDGNIWFGGFGSMHGVYCYNGKTIKVF